jgi:hypothetical protein
MSDITASESIVSESIVSGRLKNGEKTKLAASYNGAESYNSFREVSLFRLKGHWPGGLLLADGAARSGRGPRHLISPSVPPWPCVGQVPVSPVMPPRRCHRLWWGGAACSPCDGIPPGRPT